MIDTLSSIIQFVLEGEIGRGHEGDIAVDDMAVLEGSCVKIVLQGREYLRKEYFTHTGTMYYNFKIFVLVENADCYFDSNKCGWKGHRDWQQSRDQPNDNIPRIVKAGIQKIRIQIGRKQHSLIVKLSLA